MKGEIEQLVTRLNDHPDPLHGDRTPAVDALVRYGLPALPHVLPLLESGDDLTRLRAQRVLEGVSQEWVRERTPGRPLTREDTHEWNDLWRVNGGYDWQAPPRARSASVARWNAWLARQHPGEDGL
jgi:hypothetical protein